MTARAFFSSSCEPVADVTRTGDGETRSIALIFLGYALAGMERMDDAIEAFDKALTLCDRFEWHHYAVSARAGLARVSLSSGEVADAKAHLRKVLRHIEAYPLLYGTLDPMRVYLTCYRVLLAADDPRATEILNNAYHLLQTWAISIDNEELRLSFLEKVPANREILKEFRQNQQQR